MEEKIPNIQCKDTEEIINKIHEIEVIFNKLKEVKNNSAENSQSEYSAEDPHKWWSASKEERALEKLVWDMMDNEFTRFLYMGKIASSKGKCFCQIWRC